jgi:hypothetical protein
VTRRAIASRLRGILAAVLCSASVLLAGGGRARADAPTFELPLVGETTFSMTSTTTFRYRGSNYNANLYDDDIASLAQRFDLALQGEEIRLEVRLDAFVPHTIFEAPRCTPDIETLCRITWDVRPERITLRWESGEWSLEAGDSQLVLGRGIALAFRKVDLLAVDTALRGAHVRYDGAVFDARVHAGVANPQNQDPITLEIRQDPDDVVVAGALGVTIPGATALTIGVHATHLWFADDAEGGRSETDRQLDVIGWSVEAPALADGRLALYAEANALRRTWHLGAEEDRDTGRAIYASAQVQGDELTVLLELAEYRNFAIAAVTQEDREWRIYGSPATLEYEGPQLLRAVGNRRGGTVRVDYAFLPGPWSFSVNQALFGFADEPHVDPWEDRLVSHTWLGLARRQEYGEQYVWSTNAVFGYRHEGFVEDPATSVAAGGDVDRQMVHGQVEVTVGSGDHSFDVSADHRWERWLVLSGYREFQVGGASVTYSWGVPLALTLSLRWSDFRRDELQRREMDPYRERNFLGGALYPSFEGRWSFDPGTYLKAFVGATPGGQICSGGVCRTVPAFEGFSLQFVGRL